jgi:hypothetical protein
MISRCTNPNCRPFHLYGGRGIAVDPRWLGRDGFNNFRKDMGPKPSPAHTLERMDTNKGYGPENCCWDTRTAQARNTRANRLITISGSTKCVAEWAEISGVPSSAIRKRIDLGWPPERLLEPSRAHR